MRRRRKLNSTLRMNNQSRRRNCGRWTSIWHKPQAVWRRWRVKGSRCRSTYIYRTSWAQFKQWFLQLTREELTRRVDESESQRKEIVREVRQLKEALEHASSEKKITTQRHHAAITQKDQTYDRLKKQLESTKQVQVCST